jgi:hypothetical protein
VALRGFAAVVRRLLDAERALRELDALLGAVELEVLGVSAIWSVFLPLPKTVTSLLVG